MLQTLDNILLNPNVVENFHKNFQEPKFREWILKILPELENCEKLKQDNPWHIYGCLDHILHSVEAINLQTQHLTLKTKRLLAYTMFLHDIGKPQCHIRRYSKLYGREVDSFFNHNKAGVAIANRALPSFGFSATEQEILKQFIDMHDIFMFITLDNDNNPHHKVLSNNLLLEHIHHLNKFGNGFELMKQLIMIGIADNKAQNPEMTGSSLHMLQVATSMMKNLAEENQK